MERSDFSRRIEERDVERGLISSDKKGIENTYACVKNSAPTTLRLAPARAMLIRVSM
jgi:hypothetical protein